MTEKRRWRTVLFRVKRDMTDEAATALARLTGTGVMTGDDGEHCLITAYIAEDRAPGETAATVAAWARSNGVDKVGEGILEEEDWLAGWKRGFTAMRVGRRLIVAPSWETPEPADGQTVITIDPGTAFGTGHHESTALALGFIESLYEAPVPPGRVLDIGCGTGILAIACARLGARSVLAVDCDPEAVRMTAQNARANGVTGTIRATATPVDKAGSGFDLACANIIHNTLVGMAGTVAGSVRPGGWLILAGILEGWQEDNIERTYGQAGFTVAGRRRRNEWVALLMRRGER